MDWQVVSVLVSAFGGLAGLAALLTSAANAKISARKADVEILQSMIDTLSKENERLRKEIEDLRGQNSALQERVEEVEAENEQLRKKLGMTAFRRPMRKGLATHDD